MYSFPILIGDIGGTNSRFAMIEKPGAQMIQFDSAKNADFTSFELAIKETVFSKTDLRPKTMFLAVAGPTGDIEGIKLTNCPWMIDVYQLIKTLDIEQAVAMSDFEAQALAAIATDPSEHSLIKEGVMRPHAARAVLGPGTGLGQAGMIFVDGQWTIIPGEGGFVDIGPRGTEEMAIFGHAFGETERPAAELFLSGRGLLSLYQAVCKHMGQTSDIDEPAGVSKAYAQGNDPAAQKTMALFATFLGRFASDAALVYLARGGVFLTGGVAQKLEAVLKLGFFNDAFLDKEPYGDIVKELPVYLMTEPLVALYGLYAYANEPDLFRISRQGRHWQNQK